MARARLATFLAAATVLFAGSAHAQNRGVYPLGMSATGSGVFAEPGLTYANQFLFYARSEEKGPDGETVATGHNSVLMDMNTVVWASDKPVSWLGGARYAASATIPVANNSLSSEAAGAISGGGGLADSYYLPLILGWRTPHVDVKAMYGFLAPTGRFDAGATDNVGSGYWTHTLSTGQTFYLSKDRAWTLSAFEMIEFHTAQESTEIRPGDTVDLDWSATRLFSPRDGLRVQAGIVGYGARQTTEKTGPGMTPTESSARYEVNSLGFVVNLLLPDRKTSLGFKYFKEFSNVSTFEGHSAQISASIAF